MISFAGIVRVAIGNKHVEKSCQQAEVETDKIQRGEEDLHRIGDEHRITKAQRAHRERNLERLRLEGLEFPEV